MVVRLGTGGVVAESMRCSGAEGPPSGGRKSELWNWRKAGTTVLPFANAVSFDIHGTWEDM